VQKQLKAEICISQYYRRGDNEQQNYRLTSPFAFVCSFCEPKRLRFWQCDRYAL